LKQNNKNLEYTHSKEKRLEWNGREITMNQKTKNETVALVRDLLAAPMTCPQAKAEAQIWLATLGTSKEKEETKRLLQELSEDVTSISDLAAFAVSPYAEKEFGKEGAKAFRAHVEEIQKQGAQYCDCPACNACLKILAKKDELLK